MKKYLPILIVLLATALRFYQLGSYPALNADEAAIGYNAYSLIQTGKDEHGNSWPLHFQSFNDYKPGLAFYLVVPFVKLFGLTTWAVRIPGALFGVATVVGIYFLTKELFSRRNLSILAAFLLAINPWHIHFSRGIWEVNIATFFIVFGFLYFLKGLKNNKLYLHSFLLFVASLYTYHAARVIVPLLGLGLLLVFREKLKKSLKPLFVAALVSFLFLIPLVPDLLSENILSRATGVGIFSDPGTVSRINEQRGEHGDFQGVIPKVFHNKAVNYTVAFFENWAEHFHGEFLFLSGEEIQRNKVPEIGQMHLFSLPFIIIGIYGIARRPKGWKPVILWLLIAPTAAALTFQSPHALRAQNMVIPLTIISAYGFLLVLESIGKLKKKQLITLNILVFSFVVWSLLRYQHMYWVHMAKEYPFSSQYGVSELVDYIEEENVEGRTIVITTRYDQPYILTLFYLGYPPEKFQEEHTLTPRDEFGFSTVREFGNFVFTEIGELESIKNAYPGSLIAGTDEEISDAESVKKEIYGSNGYKYFEVIEN